jgi:hypothetical protein
VVWFDLVQRRFVVIIFVFGLDNNSRTEPGIQFFRGHSFLESHFHLLIIGFARIAKVADENITGGLDVEFRFARPVYRKT